MNRMTRVIGKAYYHLLHRVNPEKYKRRYPAFLKRLGLCIPEDYYGEGHGFIHPSVMFDGADQGRISIGKGTTISFDVVILTHDFSISKGLHLIGAPTSGKFIRPVHIGAHCFIGMRSLILPGTTIGDHVIVGSGSVVRGTIPDGVVIVGNPAKILCSTEEWAQKHAALGDYIEVPK